MSEASLNFAIDDALHKASDRLLKPQEAEVPQRSAAEDGQYFLLEDDLFVKDGNAYKKLPVSEILWIQADHQYCQIKTRESNMVVSTNLGNFSRQFDHPSLLRISRSHIINVHHIDGFEENLAIVSGHPVPIGKTYREEVQRKFRFLKTTR